MNHCVVLDKSFVRGASGKEVGEICDSQRAIMLEDLFFELIRSDPETRTKSFRKFPTRENPVAVLPNVGTLMRYEKEHRRPCTPVWEHRMQWSFRFNEKLAAGDFGLNEQQARAVNEWERGLSEDVRGFDQRGRIADRLFPELVGHRPGENPDKLRALISRIATDLEAIREIYRAFTPADFPPAAIVGRTWAVFRWFQVHLIAVVEFFGKYGAGVNPASEEKLENERTDLNYLIVAVLAGGLATRDRAMARRFKALCPNGDLIE